MTVYSVALSSGGSLAGTQHWGDIALRFSGSSGIGASVANTGVQNISITTTQNNSAIAVMVLDWNGVDGTGRVWETVNGTTPTAGNGFEVNYTLDTGNYGSYTAYYPDAGTAGAKTVGLSAPTGMAATIIAVEVLGAGTVSGSFALPALGFSATNKSQSGTGSFALPALQFSGSNSFKGVPPTVPVIPAGTVAKSSDLNTLGYACEFLLNSLPGNAPSFFLMANAVQAISATPFTQITFSNAAAVFKDNAGGYVPGGYTIQAAGYYHIEWSVSAASGAGNLECFAEVATSASNPYNPSSVIAFQHTNRAATTAVTVASNGGLVPVYLVPGDLICLFAVVGTAVNTSATFYPQLSGHWVSE